MTSDLLSRSGTEMFLFLVVSIVVFRHLVILFGFLRLPKGPFILILSFGSNTTCPWTSYAVDQRRYMKRLKDVKVSETRDSDGPTKNGTGETGPERKVGRPEKIFSRWNLSGRLSSSDDWSKAVRETQGE